MSDHAAEPFSEPLLSPRGREIALWLCVGLGVLLVLWTAYTRTQATATLGLATALLVPARG